jgi:hypothetical protein
MKKKILSLLIIISLLGAIGCSKEHPSPTNLKQEYAKTFSPSFLIEAKEITKLSVDLYTQAINDKVPERETFISKYEDFNNIKVSNADEKDFQDYVDKFRLYYSMLATDNSLLIGEQYLRDKGMQSKNEHEKFMKKYTTSKEENLKEIKSRMKNIINYYE